MSGSVALASPHVLCPGPHPRGLTLLELVVVMAILAIMAGVALPTLGSIIDNQTEDETALRMEAVAEGIRAYARDHLSVPASLLDLTQSPGTTHWRGPYMSSFMEGWAGKVPDYQKDNWGRIYRWQPAMPYDGALTSAGANGTFDDQDDLTLLVDIRPILRDATLERLRVINTAILAYNATYQYQPALAGSPDQVLQSLRSAGFLPADDTLLRDAFGTDWLTSGDPVTAFYSQNVLYGYQPGSIGPGGGQGGGQGGGHGGGNNGIGGGVGGGQGHRG